MSWGRVLASERPSERRGVGIDECSDSEHLRGRPLPSETRRESIVRISDDPSSRYVTDEPGEER